MKKVDVMRNIMGLNWLNHQNSSIFVALINGHGNLWISPTTNVEWSKKHEVDSNKHVDWINTVWFKSTTNEFWPSNSKSIQTSWNLSNKHGNINNTCGGLMWFDKQNIEFQQTAEAKWATKRCFNQEMDPCSTQNLGVKSWFSFYLSCEVLRFWPKPPLAV